uniref:Uncharacterized protein n=1 Tax=Romanomermis culicivorax TaxID=13658 RepID=A0A915J984_ROMCU
MVRLFFAIALSKNMKAFTPLMVREAIGADFQNFQTDKALLKRIAALECPVYLCYKDRSYLAETLQFLYQMFCLSKAGNRIKKSFAFLKAMENFLADYLDSNLYNYPFAVKLLTLTQWFL